MKSPMHPDVEMKTIVKDGIEIDYCPVSGGVWLDHGELEKLLAKVREERQQVDMAPKFDDAPSHGGHDQKNYDQKHYDQKHYPKHKKKESFVENLFDFF